MCNNIIRPDLPPLSPTLRKRLIENVDKIQLEYIIHYLQTKEITGTDKVNGITYVNRETGEETHVELQGVFVLIGLVPNTDWLGEAFEKTRMGEIVVDKRGATNVPGVFAAGDCTDSAYKQIIISMGSGATAALGAFDYLIRN